MGRSESSDEKETGATIQCKKSWVSSFYGANFTYLRHNRPCVFRTPLPLCSLAKKDLLHSPHFSWEGDINRTKAFFPDFIVQYANFGEKYLV